MPLFLVKRCVVNPMKYQTKGTILSAYLALEKGFAFNLGGGFHHASRNMGSGFCVFADISLAVAALRRHNLVEKVLIIDLDAHQGNGHERDHINDDNTFIYDVYNPDIYPNDVYAKQGIDKSVHVRRSTTDEEYLVRLKSDLKDIIKSFSPEIIIYNAGTDCLDGDPLGDLNISSKGIIKRDLIVFKMAIRHNIPITYLFSGGYQASNSRVISDSMINIFRYLQKKNKM